MIFGLVPSELVQESRMMLDLELGTELRQTRRVDVVHQAQLEKTFVGMCFSDFSVKFLVPVHRDFYLDVA